jgi:hypothetical protein
MLDASEQERHIRAARNVSYKGLKERSNESIPCSAHFVKPGVIKNP